MWVKAGERILNIVYLSICLCQTAPEYCQVSHKFLRETEAEDIKKATSVWVCVVGASSAIISVLYMHNSSEIWKKWDVLLLRNVCYQLQKKILVIVIVNL